MTAEEEVSLETDHLEEVIETAPPGQQVVVIQYRNRGVPLYVVFLLLMAVSLVAVAFYHRVSARRRMFEPPRVLQQAALPVLPPPASATVPAQPASEIIPLALNTQPIAPGSLSVPLSPVPAAHPEPVKPGATAPAARPDAQPIAPPAKQPPDAPKPSEPHKLATAGPKPATEPPKAATEVPGPSTEKQRNSVASLFTIPAPPKEKDDPFAELYGPQNTADSPDAKPVDAPPVSVADNRAAPTREQLLQDINAEAAEKRQKLNELRDLKDRAGDELAAEAFNRTEDERLVFRRELGEILQSGSRKAGQEINDLCERYGRNYDPALKDKVSRALMLANGRKTTEAKLNLLRHYGVPEPGLLDYIANQIEHNQLNARNGPRTPDQVRVLAARQLLRTRLTKTAKSASRKAYDPTDAPVARSSQGR